MITCVCHLFLPPPIPPQKCIKLFFLHIHEISQHALGWSHFHHCAKHLVDPFNIEIIMSVWGIFWDYLMHDFLPFIFSAFTFWTCVSQMLWLMNWSSNFFIFYLFNVFSGMFLHHPALLVFHFFHYIFQFQELLFVSVFNFSWYFVFIPEIMCSLVSLRILMIGTFLFLFLRFYSSHTYLKWFHPLFHYLSF